jgi:AcrR family transcriptional regulator
METMRRSPGRPRSTEADAAILDATVELFAEAGFEGLTIEGVAARAGVGKGTIYRRYPNKLDLVLSAVRCYARAGEPAPDTGTTRGDVGVLVDDFVTVLTDTPVGRLVPNLMVARRRVPELELAHAEITDEARSRSATVVRRAVARGDFRVGVDADLVADMFAGAVFYRFVVTRKPLDERFRGGLVEAVLRAFAAD